MLHIHQKKKKIEWIQKIEDKWLKEQTTIPKLKPHSMVLRLELAIGVSISILGKLINASIEYNFLHTTYLLIPSATFLKKKK